MFDTIPIEYFLFREFWFDAKKVIKYYNRFLYGQFYLHKYQSSLLSK